VFQSPEDLFFVSGYFIKIAVYGNPQPSVAQEERQRPEQGGAERLLFFPAQSAAVPDSCQSKNKLDSPVRSLCTHNRGERKKYNARERGKTDIVPAVIDGQLQPGVIFSEVQPAFQPGERLQRIRSYNRSSPRATGR